MTALVAPVVGSRTHPRGGAEKEVSVDRGGAEMRQVRNPRQMAGTWIKQKKSKKMKVISDSLGSVTTWFFWTLFFLTVLDFHLRQFVRKW